MVVWLGLAGLRMDGILQPMELLSYDYLLSLRKDSLQNTPIVLIRETEEDIQRYGHPLSDAILADSLEKLLAAGANVIGVDKYRDLPVAPGTEKLNSLLTKHNNIIWIFFVGDNRQAGIDPPTILNNSAQIGFNNTINDPDDISRRGLLFLDNKGVTHYAFPLLLALHYLATQHIQPENDPQGYLRLGNSSFVPLQENTGGYSHTDAGGYQFLLTYPHIHSNFKSFSLGDLLEDKIPEKTLRNKIVLIGATASSLGDDVAFPDGSNHYGVELHAHITDQIIQTALHDYPLLRDWSETAEYLWLFICCLLGSTASFHRGGILRLSFISSFGLLLLFAWAVVCFQQGLWLPLLPSILAWLSSLIFGVFWFSSLDRYERRQLLQLFQRHVSPQVAATLWDKRDEFFIAGGVKPDQLTATVLFTDLADFTTVAETMSPLSLMSWLNEYMNEMSSIIIAENGMINKYIGDAIMAVFGVPVKKTDQAGITADALNAVESAVRMREKLQLLNSHWQEQGLPAISMRVGIYTGLLVAGTIGGQQRMEYTVIGDTVNTASRLKSFDKNVVSANEQHCRILVGEPTWQLIRDHYVTELVGEYQLKGKHNTLTIYNVIGRITHSSNSGIPL
jgi:adenylate cyclase